MDRIYFNFLTLGVIIPFVMCMLMGVFIMLIKNKSPATGALGGLFFFFAFFISAYIIAQAYYHPNAAFHRWLTVAFILPGFVIFNLFMLRFPTVSHPNFTRRLIIGQLIISMMVTAVFVKYTLNAGVKFHFTGHYWDFDAEGVSRFVAIFILLFMVTGIAISFWRIKVVQGKQRTAVILIATIFMVATIAPALTNFLSRDGVLDRGFHQTVLVLVTVTGFFAIFVIFLNNTEDKTTFMTKIIGVTVVTFLLLMQAVGFFALRDQEDSYNIIHREKSSRIIDTGDYSRDPELEYVGLIELNTFDQSVKLLKKAADDIDFSPYQPEFFNTAFLERLLRTPVKRFREEVTEKLVNPQNYFSGYHGALSAFIRGTSLEGAALKEALIGYIAKLDHDNYIHYNKIRMLENDGFDAKLKKYIQVHAGDPDFVSFQRVIDREISSQTNEGIDLKYEVLKYLAPIKPAGARLYREALGQKAHYVSFMRYDAENKRIHEVGFSYRSYRHFVHHLSKILIITLLVIVAGVLLLFPLFFRGSLIKPLEDLLGGVEKVNSGDLETLIPVRVVDEIGFLAGSFNRMVASIKDARKRLQDYAENLEEKVAERTRELQETLEQVQALKNQQDGDYFLTTLLIKPLGVNRGGSDRLNVDFLVKQKKEFEFRHWRNEIGGDINIAHNIMLKGKAHTVFLNADAMGKSMQGAGGALVVGAVFHSIIERTKMSSSMQDQYPERWLRNAFIELHNIFVSFEGSMLVSVVIGLVDERTGLVYYVNAEHPWSILYRDRTASFIETELAYRKLGTTGMEGELAIQTFQLQPGDVLIAGSDGRDDILTGNDKDGNRIINEDETRILNVIQKADGDLEKIHEILKQQGELTDDLSLLRIGYLERSTEHHHPPVSDQVRSLLIEANNAINKGQIEQAVQSLEAAYKLDDRQIEVIEKLAKGYYKLKNFEKAAYYADDYIYLRPADSDFVYLASYCNKMTGSLAKATDLGERLRLRDPAMVKNLINLADIYALQKNFARAEELLKRAIQEEPDNRKAREILDIIHKSGK